MKDIYDLFDLASTRSWSARRVAEAVQLTFLRRQTSLPTELPIMFSPDFYADVSKLSQWNAFRKSVRQNQLDSLSASLLRLKDFWWPLLEAMEARQPFDLTWNPITWRWEP